MPQTSTLLEFVLAVHFEAELPLQVLDLADWAKTFEEEFPIVEQLPSLARIDLVVNPFQLVVVPEPILPLLRLTSEDRRFYLKLQADRFALGWTRTAPAGTPDEYPGFDEMIGRWEHFGRRLTDWLSARPNMSVCTRLIELVYSNVQALDANGRTPALADVLSFMRPSGRRLNAFQMQWTELLDPSPTAARVSMSAGAATLNGTQPGVSFSFLGLGPVSGTIAGSETRDGIEALHTRILDMYEATIISAKIRGNR